MNTHFLKIIIVHTFLIYIIYLIPEHIIRLQNLAKKIKYERT
jgi:hypothetical protein